MTPKEIMDIAKKMYTDVDTTMSISGVRSAAKNAASCIYYLARNQLPPEEQKKAAKFAPEKATKKGAVKKK